MTVDLEKQKKFLTRAAFYAVVAALIYVGLKYLLPTLMPFVLAFLIVWLLRKPAGWLADKVPVKQKYILLVLLLVFYAVLFGALFLLSAQIFSLIRETIPKLPDLYRSELLPALKVLYQYAIHALERFDPTLIKAVEQSVMTLAGSIESMVKSVSLTVVSWASDAAMGVPGLIIAVILMITASFFLASDYEGIMGFVYKNMPPKVKERIREIWHKLAGSLWIYIRSYTLLLLVTFVELVIGLHILRIPYATLIAAGIAVFDLMPILGTGGVMIPWTVIAAVAGHYGMALGVGVLYIIITIIRNYLEPKLVGKQIGLHPLATLMALFVGSQLFGLAGLFGFPVALSVIVQIRRGEKDKTAAS